MYIDFGSHNLEDMPITSISTHTYIKDTSVSILDSKQKFKGSLLNSSRNICSRDFESGGGT